MRCRQGVCAMEGMKQDKCSLDLGLEADRVDVDINFLNENGNLWRTKSTNDFCIVFTLINPKQIHFLKIKFIYLFIYGCVGSSLLCAGFL